MIDTRIARLFKIGAAQAVRLPAEFHFAGENVFASRDDATGDVLLSTRPGTTTWGEFFALAHALDLPEDFMAERPMNAAAKTAGVFDDTTDA